MEHTGNLWEHRRNFKKQPGRYMLMDLDMGQDKKDIISLENSGLKSSLHPSVQGLIKMIFDVKAMESTMLEFEVCSFCII
jgi:hypothetical protein